MVTKDQALSNNIYHSEHLNKPNKCLTWRTNGMGKTWVRDPNRFKVPIKYGMYDYAYLTETNAHLFHLPEDCPNAR